jgi:hypothetical protein
MLHLDIYCFEVINKFKLMFSFFVKLSLMTIGLNCLSSKNAKKNKLNIRRCCSLPL